MDVNVSPGQLENSKLKCGCVISSSCFAKVVTFFLHSKNISEKNKKFKKWNPTCPKKLLFALFSNMIVELVNFCNIMYPSNIVAKSCR